MPDSLRKALNDHRAIVSRLREEFPDESDDTLRDMILGETYLDGAIAAVLREAEAIEAMAEIGLNQLITEMGRRQERMRGRAARLKAFALWATQEAGWKKIEAPDFVASINAGRRKVIITSEADLPPRYVKQKVIMTPDKKAIGDAIGDGEEVPGASLGNPSPFWSIRR